MEDEAVWITNAVISEWKWSLIFSLMHGHSKVAPHPTLLAAGLWLGLPIANPEAVIFTW